MQNKIKVFENKQVRLFNLARTPFSSKKHSFIL